MDERGAWQYRPALKPSGDERRESALDAEQVGVWLFEPKKRPRGSVVKEIPFDEYGYSGTGFDEVASALHNCSRATITRHRAGCGFPIRVFRILITTRVVNIRWVMAGASDDRALLGHRPRTSRRRTARQGGTSGTGLAGIEMVGAWPASEPSRGLKGFRAGLP